MVPQAMAYAGIAGVPVQNGLYVFPLAIVGYAWLGSSHHLFVGPSATVATLSASSVAVIATASTGSAEYIAGAVTAARLRWRAIDGALVATTSGQARERDRPEPRHRRGRVGGAGRGSGNFCHRSTTTTSYWSASGGNPVSNLAFAAAKRSPKRATVAGTWNSALVITLRTTPDR